VVSSSDLTATCLSRIGCRFAVRCRLCESVGSMCSETLHVGRCLDENAGMYRYMQMWALTDGKVKAISRVMWWLAALWVIRASPNEVGSCSSQLYCMVPQFSNARRTLDPEWLAKPNLDTVS